MGVMMKKEASRNGTLLLVLLLLGCTSALADVYKYEWNGTAYKKAGRYKTPGQDEAYICKNGTCVISITCGICHAQQPSLEGYTSQEQEKHFNRYYPTKELTLQPGQQIDFAGLKLLRERNRLIAVDERGGRHLMPQGAKILKSKSGKEPEVIIYRGSTAPW
jgi:hypothetical protein